MQPSAVVLQLKQQPQEDWQRALSETTDKQPAAESRFPASPRGTGDQAKGHSRMHKGTPLAFKAKDAFQLRSCALWPHTIFQ